MTSKLWRPRPKRLQQKIRRAERVRRLPLEERPHAFVGENKLGSCGFCRRQMEASWHTDGDGAYSFADR